MSDIADDEPVDHEQFEDALHSAGTNGFHAVSPLSPGNDDDDLTWPLGAFFGISLCATDRVRLIDGPASLIPQLRDVLNEAWPKGIKEEKEAAQGVWQFKMKGDPWVAQDAASRHLIKSILQLLYSEGFMFYTSVVVGDFEKDGWTFKVCPRPYKVGYFFAMDIFDTDRLRVVDMPDDFLSDFKEVVTKWWPGGIQKEKEKKVEKDDITQKVFALKLKGTPWTTQGEAIHDSRRLITNIMKAFHERGFSLYASLRGSIWIFHSTTYEARASPTPSSPHTPEDKEGNATSTTKKHAGSFFHFGSRKSSTMGGSFDKEVEDHETRLSL